MYALEVIALPKVVDSCFNRIRNTSKSELMIGACTLVLTLFISFVGLACENTVSLHHGSLFAQEMYCGLQLI